MHYLWRQIGSKISLSDSLLANPTQSVSSTGTQNSSGKQINKKIQPAQKSMLEKMRETLDKDRKRTPISNVILRCSEPPNINVVVTLRTANLRDLTLTELHKNNVRIVGKVTRIVEDGQTISAFENCGMSMVKPEMLTDLFNQLANRKDVVAEFSEVQIKGPAVQILPLMIFVWPATNSAQRSPAARDASRDVHPKPGKVRRAVVVWAIQSSWTKKEVRWAAHTQSAKPYSGSTQAGNKMEMWRWLR